MATTEPLTGVTVQDQSDAATGGAQVGNLAKSIAKFTVPRFTSTTTRDTAYTAFVSAGGAMADGMLCTAAGVPYRRINGTWRIDHPRVISRVANLASGSGSIVSGGSTETGVTTGATLTGGSTFILYEACTLSITAALRVGPNPANTAVAAQCTVKLNGAAVGNFGISRIDQTIPLVATVALAAGTHTVSLRVDAVGGAVSWVDGIVNLTECTAE